MMMTAVCLVLRRIDGVVNGGASTTVGESWWLVFLFFLLALRVVIVNGGEIVYFCVYLVSLAIQSTQSILSIIIAS